MTASILTPRLFREQRAILGESLVWDADAGDLLWGDITAGLLHRSRIDGAVDGSDDTVLSLPAPIASFHCATIGGEAGFVASLGDRVVLAGPGGDILREIGTIAHAQPGMRLNEGKVDPRGRWVTGSMDLTTGQPDGAFYSVTAESGARVISGGFGTANGLEWSQDGRRIYFTDTSVTTIYTGVYDENGDISETEPFLTGEMFDGLAADADGCFWTSVYGGSVVLQVDAGGRELERIELPVPNLTSVAFGGEDMSTLFVTSARENLTEDDLERHPLSGSVFAIPTRTHGFAARVFSA